MDDAIANLDAAIGTHVVVIDYEVVDWATAALAEHLPTESLRKLKLASGEHLAAMLTTAYLGIVPVSLDLDGGVDLTFKAADSANSSLLSLLGRHDVEFADFEVKSLPGNFREHDAVMTRAVEKGEDPPPHVSTWVSANDVVEAASGMIAKAARQLKKKSSADRATVVFVVSHFLDRPYVECLLPMIGPALAPLTAPDGIDSVWMFFAPAHLVVWSAVEQRWTQLLVGSFKEHGNAPEYDFGMALLQHYEGLFLERAGIDGPSPFYYGISDQAEG